jgi:hypothetical protein
LEQFKESVEEKKLMARVLVRIQETYEEREMLLRRHLTDEDIDRLISDEEPDTVRTKYIHAICGHTLRSFSECRLVGRSLI